ncbi:hypothetical protein GALMADRAFT_266655 [Galerina marginata CBS 339.88]|uniref:Uncharacterized protein n=1 Tax=Galerina marginata (strain CBS 339.88) TaxID=685588 RepID=A0A067T6Z7_GALM3|nr:hypothetical protein GALMADRAFT_266655 [Galerina marginata CBS 339.88]
MASSNPVQPRKLNRGEKYRFPAVYGFPLRPDKIEELLDSRNGPVPSNLSTSEEDCYDMKKIGELYDHLLNECNNLKLHKIEWSRGISFTINNPKDPDADRAILVLVRCTRRDDRFIPAPHVMEAFKEVMEREGFREEPRWFTVKS